MTDARAGNPDAVIAAYPWLPTIDGVLAEVGLPVMHGKTLYVTSDYSGQHRESRYFTSAVLLADLEECDEWESRRRSVRAEHLSDGRRMAFKNLNDRQRQKALAPFLCAAGSINGLLATVAVDKRIQWLISAPGFLEQMKQSRRVVGKWSRQEFEYMARMAFFTSLFSSRVLRPGQDIIWISDEDQAFANEARKADAARLAGTFADIFFRVPVGALFMGTTDIDPGDRAEDYAAIADILAGAVADVFTVAAACSFWPGLGEIPEGTKPKSDFVLHWLMEAPKRLKHVLILFHQNPDGRLRVGRITFTRA